MPVLPPHGPPLGTRASLPSVLGPDPVAASPGRLPRVRAEQSLRLVCTLLCVQFTGGFDSENACKGKSHLF